MYCSNCGAEIKADARFCAKCGTTVAPSADTTDAVAPPAAAVVTEPARRPWRAVTLGLALIAVLGGGFFGWRTITQPKLSDTRINPVDQAEMVWVPGGTFTMGSIDGVGGDNEHPAHQVTLSGYWIYKYEVTVAQYREFCTATGRTLPGFPQLEPNTFPPNYSWEGKSGWTDPTLQQYPIVNITWHDAKAYTDWAGVSLPTEAQWEYAARGPEGRNYPWGGTGAAADQYNGWDQTKCANAENSYAQKISTWPVGSFPRGGSWCGALDMAGNVWEWCGDCYENYSSTPITNPTGPPSGPDRVQRGGSWRSGSGWEYFITDVDSSSSNLTRSAYRRNGGNPTNRDNSVGFRCVSDSQVP